MQGPNTVDQTSDMKAGSLQLNSTPVVANRKRAGGFSFTLS